jgi:hypothetical protein
LARVKENKARAMAEVRARMNVYSMRSLGRLARELSAVLPGQGETGVPALIVMSP